MNILKNENIGLWYVDHPSLVSILSRVLQTQYIRRFMHYYFDKWLNEKNQMKKKKMAFSNELHRIIHNEFNKRIKLCLK